ncbi:arylsulfatase A-like enzyme [Amorphus suaedae]
MTRRPNFLVIMTDQQRWDHLGCYGNRQVRTPTIDAIARGGTRFDRFYVSNPICQPNRACLATGQISTVNGCRQNGIPLSPESVTYADVLRAAGYRTALIGKAHFQNVTNIPAPPRKTGGAGDEVDASVHRAWRTQRTGDGYGLEARSRWHADPAASLPEPYYGFEHVRLCIGHGDQVDGHYTGWLRDRHPDPDSLRGPENALDRESERTAQCWRTAVPEALHPTRYVAEEACAFLEAQTADDPFLLVMSFPDPHHPFTPPDRYFDMYDPESLDLPASFDSPVRDRNDLPEAVLEAYRMGDTDPNSHWPYHVDAAGMRRILALNYGSISFIDDELAWVMATLKARGLDRDTVVCFMSDHGDYMGDHGTVLKMGLHYQSVIRVPFLWRDPQAAGAQATTDIQASAIDFAPTLLQRAGLKVPVGMQGRDLFAADAANLPVVVEDPGISVFADADARSAILSVVHEGWRLSLFEQAPGRGELYHFAEDPDEMANLWDATEASARKADLLEKLCLRQLALRDMRLCPTARA